jgi:hypothetical protein
MELYVLFVHMAFDIVHPIARQIDHYPGLLGPVVSGEGVIHLDLSHIGSASQLPDWRIINQIKKEGHVGGNLPTLYLAY